MVEKIVSLERNPTIIFNSKFMIYYYEKVHYNINILFFSYIFGMSRQKGQ